MKKIYNLSNYLSKIVKQQTILLLIFTIFSVTLSAQTSTTAQKVTKMSVKSENTSVKAILAQIEKDNNIRFFYDEKNVDVNKISSINVQNVPLEDILNVLFNNKVGYKISENNVIVLTPKSQVQATASAQKVSVTGKVIDNNGKPIIGVSVMADGGRVGTTTDNEGHFSLKNIAVGSNLSFQFIGMSTVSAKTPANGSPVNIQMVEDALTFEDIIITGFGSMKKSAYAGSASTVRTEGLKDVPSNSIGGILQGMVSGVSVSSGVSGQPGAPSSIRIRGVGSYSANNEPLYVIDGVPVISGDIGGGIGSSGVATTDAMATINPSDIENITVIKDAAAASLYGSRAANGVILITTKQGKKGTSSFNFKADFGFSNFATDFRPVLKGDERHQFIYDAMLRYQKYTLGNNDEASARAYADKNIEDVAPKPWSGWADWDDILMRQASYNNYEFSASGATDKFNYYTSLAYTKQEGIQRTQSLDRLSGRVNARYQATKKLELGANIMFSQIQQNVGYDGMEYNAPLYASKHKLTSSDAPYNKDGTFNRELLSNGKYNPLAVQLNNYSRQYATRAFNTMYGQYSIIDELKLKSTLSYDYTITKAKKWSDPNGSSDYVENGSAYKRYEDFAQMVWSTNLNYVKTFKEKHNIDALVAYEITRYDQDYLSGSSTGFLNSSRNEIGNGSQPKSIGGIPRAYRMISYISKVNYDYDSKYFIGGSYRMDGTSRLRPENRWGSFWSASAAWRFIEEPFMDPIKHVVTDGKLRFSYGANGTQPSNYYAGMNLNEYGNDYNQMSGQLEQNLVAENLVWESNYNTNIGIDFTLFDKVSITAEYYNRKTKDLLMNAPISLTTGHGSVLTNIGSFRNTGFELEVNSQNITNKDFTWSTQFNISTNKNKILKLNGDQQIPATRQQRRVGESFYTYYLVEFAGINPDNGSPMFYDNKKNPETGEVSRNIVYTVSDADPILSKVATPSVMGGLTNSFRYKMFDLSFTLTYTLGGWSFDNAIQKSRTAGNSDAALNQIPAYYRNSWKQPGDITSTEAWIYNNPNKEMTKATTNALHSTDHLRLKNLTFGITLPQAWAQKAGLKKVRAYMAGSNLLTFAAYDQYDPEVPYDGIMSYNTPPLKTITFGIEVGF